MKTILFVAALAMLGCSKKSDDGDKAGGGGNARATACGDAAARAVGKLPAGASGGEVQAKLKTIIATRCTEDQWPTTTVHCYATQVNDMADMKKCRETLPKEQQDKLMGEIRAVMAGAAGGGGPMHGGGGGGAPAPTPTPAPAAPEPAAEGAAPGGPPAAPVGGDGGGE